MPRDYRKEYDNYQGQPEQIKNRAERNAARAKLKKKGAPVAGKDVAHVKALSKGGSNRDDVGCGIYDVPCIPYISKHLVL